MRTGSIPVRVITKTQKMVLDAVQLNTQHYKIWIKGKVVQSREWSRALLYTSVQLLLKRKPSGRPRLRSSTSYFTYMYIYIYIYIQQVIIQASFVEDDGALFVFHFLFYFFKSPCYFSCDGINKNSNCPLKTTLRLMTIKSMVKRVWAEDMGQFLYYQIPTKQKQGKLKK